jgi:arabinosaccharide transport system permease protein
VDSSPEEGLPLPLRRKKEEVRMDYFKKNFSQKRLVPYMFLVPFLTIFFLFRVWPVLYGVMLSFQELKAMGAASYVGLANYSAISRDPIFWLSLKSTTYYTGGTLLTLIPIPLLLAVFLISPYCRGDRVYRMILLLPVLTSLVVAGTVFRLILADRAGLLNYFLGFLGIPAQRWLVVGELAIPSIIILAFWRWTGMNIVYFSSGLASIPSEIYEAASIDGANSFQKFFHITVPMLKPIITFVLVISLIGGYQVFVEPYILFPAGRTPGQAGQTVVLYLYRKAFRFFDMGYASAIGVVLAIVICAITFAQFRLFGFFKKIE